MESTWMRGRRTAATFTILVLITAGLTGVAGVAGVAQAAPTSLPVMWTAPAAPGAAVRTVTLVTGDRVTVVAGGVAIQRGPGRERIQFVTQRVDDRLRVIPSDAMSLLRSGRLDDRLFDVTGLLAAGYDDRRGNLPLIIEYADGVHAAAAPPAGASAVRDLPSINAVAVRQSHRDATAFWRAVAGSASLAPGVRRLWLDGVRTPLIEGSVPQVGAPVAHRAGFTGAGVAVAVLDTGIDDTHPDLAGQVTARRNFSTEDDLDHFGHGTHVASIIAGTGAASGGRFTGVAPGATLYDAKVCDRAGQCFESSVLAGMQWAAEEMRAKVVNLSLGGPAPDFSPLELAVDRLTAAFGTLFVVAAGNEGRDASILSPGVADSALTVGAVTKRDGFVSFSSRGPRTRDFGIKPDIAAPGFEITAALSKDAPFTVGTSRYFTASGTSMATPHVAGAAAILAQRRPDWSPPRLKAALMASARPLPDLSVFSQGAGRLDVGLAIDQTIVSEPVSVSFGLQTFPHHDDTPVTRTVTYRNTGRSAVKLALALRTTGSGGLPTPAGMFTVKPSSVTVPAGRTASVAVTVDTRVRGLEGFLGGSLTATGGGQVVQTPLGVQSEVESYNVTVRQLARDGLPIEAPFALVALDRSGFFWGGAPEMTFRVPKGRYAASSSITSETETESRREDGHIWAAAVLRPELTVDRDTTLVLDARVAKPVAITVPNPRAKLLFLTQGYVINPAPAARRPLFSSNFYPPRDATRFYAAQIGSGDHLVPDLWTQVGGQWAVIGPKGINPDGSPVESPEIYSLSWYFKGKGMVGLNRAVAPKDLAKIQAEYTDQGADTGDLLTFPHLPGVDILGSSGIFPIGQPFRRTEFVNNDAGRGTQWTQVQQQRLHLGEPHFVLVSLTSPATVYQNGQTYRQVWNRPVHGPSFPVRNWKSPPSISRTDDFLTVESQLWGDSDGRAGTSDRRGDGRIALYRNGVSIVEIPDAFGIRFPISPGDAGYRLEISDKRDPAYALSTSVSAAWTFRSARPPNGGTAALPVSAVRFVPALDSGGSARAGATFRVPVVVQRQPGSGALRVRSLKVWASYDDGATWLPAPIESTSDGCAATLRHPAAPGFVSLRAKMTDTEGNTAEVTILRAYRIR